MTDTAANRTPDILTEALKLAEHGFHVIPVKPGQKHPGIPEWQNHATTDSQTITNWFTGLYRDHGIGVAPRQHGDRWLFVIDVDEHDPEQSGTETLRDLTDAYGPIPDTPTVHTGSGGQHIYLTAPYEIRNGKTARLGPGIDIRGNGGQVLAPPTLHPNGQPYTWDIEHNPDTTLISDAPEWLLALLTPPEPAKTVTRQNTGIWDQLDTSPAATYNRDNTWQQLLTTDGWTYSHSDQTGEEHWIRPGKTKRDGSSATVGYRGADVLKVFTTSLPWLPEGAYSKFKYYACRDHNGDMSQAAKHLTKQPSAPTMIAQPVDDPWPTPIPLVTVHKTPQFPLHTLPTWAVDHLTQITNNVQTPIDLPATLLLGALSTIRLNKTWINYPRQNWRQPTNLYTAVAMPPSAGKTPAKNAIFKPIENLETITLTNNRAERQHAESEQTILEKRRKNIQDELANPKTRDHTIQGSLRDELADIDEKLARHQLPPNGQLFVDDTTTEALGVAMQDAGGAIAIITAEGGLFDRIAGLYNDGKSSMDLYLEAWSGGSHKVNRIRRDPIHIPSANLTIACTVQPTTLDQIGHNTEMQGRGLIARFLLCEPPNNVGTRNRLQHTHINPHIETQYTDQITQIYHQPNIELYLEDEPSDIYAQWDQNIENQLQPGQPLEHLAEWAGKLRASVLRIAALLHHTWNHKGTQIDEQTICDAIDIGNYYLAHAQKIADRWGATPTITNARHIIDWAQRNHHTTITLRDIYSGNRRRFPTADDTREPLLLLIERGWLRPLFDGPLVIGRRGQDSPQFAVNPIVHSPVDNPVVDDDTESHARHARTIPTSETQNSLNSVDYLSHARHARTPARAREEKKSGAPVLSGNIEHLSIYVEKSPHAHTDPCAHETQLLQSTIKPTYDPDTDDQLL